MNVEWYDGAWDEYVSWLERDKKIVKRINALIKEAMRTPFTGTGKPEPLRENLKGYWSRRIDGTNRLVYLVRGDTLYILSCRGHYND